MNIISYHINIVLQFFNLFGRTITFQLNENLSRTGIEPRIAGLICQCMPKDYLNEWYQPDLSLISTVSIECWHINPETPGSTHSWDTFSHSWKFSTCIISVSVCLIQIKSKITVYSTYRGSFIALKFDFISVSEFPFKSALNISKT